MLSLLGPMLIGALAVGLVIIGRWGWTHAVRLPSATLPLAERRRLAEAYRRGAVACMGFGALLASVALLAIFLPTTG